MEIRTNESNKITCPMKVIKNPTLIVTSKSHLGEYNKTKGRRDAIVVCYSIPLRGNRVNSINGYPN